jgi:glycosyltransferase involved in cell wall biosynthesis
MADPELKAKVLFIGPYPPPFSGPELGMKLFLESSLREHFRLIFLNTNVRKNNIKKARFDHHMIAAFFTFHARLIYKILRHRPVLVYYPITATQIGWLGRDLWCLFICRLFCVRTVIHLRAGHLKLNLRTFHPWLRKWVRRACRMANLGLVQANCLRDQFEGLLPGERTKVLYNAIQADELENEDLNDYHPGVILFLGHLTQAKGYCDLVRAIPLVAARFKAVRFVFAGTLRRGERGVFFDQTTGKPLQYEDPVKVHQEISSGPYQENYAYVGLVSGKAKMELLRSAEVFALPSYSEGFSRALLEAMAMGKPVVATPVGAHREVVQDGVHGFLVEPGNVERLADRIATLLQDKALCSRMARANYGYARENFDIAVVAEQMRRYLEEVIHEQP